SPPRQAHTGRMANKTGHSPRILGFTILAGLTAGQAMAQPSSPIAAIARQSATDLAIGAPTAIVADAAGNIFFAVSRGTSPDKYVPAVLKLDRDGVLTRVAGTVGIVGQEQSGLFQNYPPALGDGGPATSALLTDPVALALDREGNLYIA